MPTLALRVSADEVLGSKGISAIGAMISRGVGIVTLYGGDESSGRLYEAACVLRSVIGDRAYLIIAERVDIAAAVGASGVLLSDQGIPTIVARNMMMKSKPDAVYLPLVARNVQTLESARNATISEGADFFVTSTAGLDYASLLANSVTKHVKVPIFFTVVDFIRDDLPSNVLSKLLQSGACGVIVSLDDLKLLGDEFMREMFSTVYEVDKTLLNEFPNSNRIESNNVRVVNGKKGISGFVKLDDNEMQLIEAERHLLHEAVTVIRKATPMMKEVSLLEDAASRLSEPFLLVIVGEFNSGKSTVINALLGRKYLMDGVVPTTNEITLLSYSETDSEQERCERHPDGQYICYLSAPILKEMNLVDTPGTNVILQRQQRLTEEYVPRADLILFVISSDRPLSESEVAFLLYVQQWKKKVVFVLNKVDLYRNISELEEAITFIKENTWKILNTEDVMLYPVSARMALEARLSASVKSGPKHDELLLNDPRWRESRFSELENFLYSFLDGSTDTGMERMRLKLGTPIGIADRLLISCERLVMQEYEDASRDLISIREVVSSVKDYNLKIESESMSWRIQTLSLVTSAKSRAINLMESILQLSNIDLIATYGFRRERSGSTPAASSIQNEILSPTLSDAQRMLSEYLTWLRSNNTREGKLYVERFKQLHECVNQTDSVESEPRALFDKGEELSMTVLQNFSAAAAARLVEQEVREAVIGTFGSLGAAGLSASLLTSVLPTTLEDLLALAFCSAGGLFAISKFPMRRKEAIDKVREIIDLLACDIEQAMQQDLMRSTENLKKFVEVISKPHEEAAQQRITQLLGIQSEITNVERRIREMKIKIGNLRVSSTNSKQKSV